MIKPSFNIEKETLEPGSIKDLRLLLEIGEKAFSYLLMNMQSKEVAVLKTFFADQYNENSIGEMIAEVVASDPNFLEHPAETIVVFSFPESNIVPAAFNDDNLTRAMTQLVYGNVRKGMILQESIPGDELLNIYRVPAELQSFIGQQFKPTRVWHVYSLLLCAFGKNGDAANQVKLIFYADHFIVAVFKNNALQLVQTFYYQTPEDVSYQVLAIGEQFGISQENMVLQVGGLIDRQSALATELEKYFMHIEYIPAPGEISNAEIFNEYPGHYFSPILNFALCV